MFSASSDSNSQGDDGFMYESEASLDQVKRSQEPTGISVFFLCYCATLYKLVLCCVVMMH